MGAEVELEGIAVTLRRKGPLHGVDFTLRLPSVGATLTLLMAACYARGRTVLRGAAQEPEIGDMVHFLQACGARILGCGTPVLTVDGGCPLAGTAHRPLPDRIAAATYAAALAAAGGEVEICGCDPAVYGAFLRFLAETGVTVTRAGDCVRLARDPGAPLRGGARLTADAWPAFATDTAPLAAAVLLTAAGESEIYDRLFANRFACAAGFASAPVIKSFCTSTTMSRMIFSLSMFALLLGQCLYCIRIQYSPDAPFWQGRPYAARRLAFLTSFRISSTTSTISSTATASRPA